MYEFRERYSKINREKYTSMTKSDIYYIIFGKTYEEDPMAMYRKDSQYQRKCYEEEIKIWVQKNKHTWGKDGIKFNILLVLLYLVCDANLYY